MQATADTDPFGETMTRLITYGRVQLALERLDELDDEVRDAEAAFTRARLGGQPHWAVAERADRAAEMCDTAAEGNDSLVAQLAALGTAMRESGPEGQGPIGSWIWAPLLREIRPTWDALAPTERERRTAAVTLSVHGPIVEGVIADVVKAHPALADFADVIACELGSSLTPEVAAILETAFGPIEDSG